MILCAGLGTRLRPLTDWLAKPMVPIGDRPAVAHIADHLRAAGFSRIVVNVHHRPEDLRAWAASSNIAVSEEPDLLGTAGGIANAASLLGDGNVLIWNGDIFAAPNLAALVESHRSEATLAITPRPAGEGNVGVDAAGRIVRLRQESFPELGAEASGGSFTGIHIVSASLRRKLPAKGCIVGDVYLPALREGAQLHAHVLAGSFVDVGSLTAYAEANRVWLGARSEWSAPTAVFAAATPPRITGSVVGAAARIEAPALSCIVWPNAVVTDPMKNAVITPYGSVPIV